MEKNKYSWQFDLLFPDKPVEITCNGVVIATSSLGNAQKLANALNAGEDMYEVLSRAFKDPSYILSGEWYIPAKQALLKADGKGGD